MDEIDAFTAAMAMPTYVWINIALVCLIVGAGAISIISTIMDR